MKKILHISNYLYPHIGGIEQVCRDCINAIDRTRYEQKVICFNHEKGSISDIVDGVEVIRVGCFAKVASQSLSFTYGKQLKKVIKEYNPDIVIFHYPNPFVAHYLLKNCKDKKFRLIIYWHLDITKQKILGKLFHGQNIRLIKKSDVVIGATPLHIETSKYYEYFKNKSRVLPYAINEGRLKINNDELEKSEIIRKENEGKKICFAIGRHVPYKGMEYLVKASKYLDDNYRIYIAGQGPLTESLKEMAKDDNKITFLGKISDSKWRSYLNACDIFCFPSITRNEAFGLALAEAMYFGKPAVTFNIYGSGVNYVNLNGVTGLEVENSNCEEYANAIKKLTSDKNLYNEYSRNAKERILNNFSEESFKENLNKLIEEI